MKKLFKTITILCFLASPGVFAQTPYETFKETAGVQSVLYRGRQATQYNLRYNGIPYWETTEFLPGSVIYNEKSYSDVLLNIDAVSMDLLVKYEQSMPAVSLHRDDVLSFDIAGQKYVNLAAQGVENAPDGYFRVLLEGAEQDVYMQVNKTLKKATDNRNGKAIGYYDPDYDPTVIEFFEYYAKYYFLNDGVLTKVGRRKAMKYVSNAK